MGLIGTAIQVAATAHENKLSRRFAERMSSTAYQRGMADMKKAGLNPILAYQKGGASSPTAGGGSFNPSMDIAGTAITALQAKAGIANTKQQEATSAATAKTIDQKRKYDLPGQKLEAAKDEVKLGIVKSAVGSAKSAGVNSLTIGPDFSNFLGRNNPGGSYIERYQRSKSRGSAARRNIRSTRRNK